MYGTREGKIFSPCYASSSTGDPGGDPEAVSLAIAYGQEAGIRHLRNSVARFGRGSASS